MQKHLFAILFSLLSLLPPAIAETVSGDLGRKLDRYLQRAAALGWSGTALVARGKEVILSGGYGLADRENKVSQTADTVFCSGSITKQFTAAAILKLEAKGLLSLQDTIAKFFPEAPADKKVITLHQLLTHTAGFPGSLGDDYDPVGSEEFSRLALAAKPLFPPGARYEYSNVGYSLLGIIVERASGKGYEQFLYENLFQPAGMQRTGYLRPGFKKEELAVGYRGDSRWGSALDRPWRGDGPGWHLRANGGILSTVGDLHRWFLALQGDSVLPAAARKKIFTPHVRENEGGDSFYGYGWVVQKTQQGKTLIWHNGGNGIWNAFMGWEAESGLCVIISSNVAGKIADDYARRIRLLAAGSAVELDEATRSAYSGGYRLPSGAAFSAGFDENDNLVLDFASPELVRLLCTSGGEKTAAVAPCEGLAGEALGGIQKGDYTALARAWNEPKADVSRRAGIYWGGLQRRFGRLERFLILGTVSRPRHLLTYVRCDFVSRPLFFTFVWSEGILVDLRESATLQRVYEAASAGQFREEPLQRTVRLDRDESGLPALVISGPAGSTTALRRQPGERRPD